MRNSVGERLSRWVIAGLLATGGLLGVAGIAGAISGGEYKPSQQDCSKTAEAYDKEDAEHGCHTLKINVESGDERYAEIGLDQLPQGDSSDTPLIGVAMPGDDNFPHAGCVAVNTDGTGGGEGNNCGNDNATPDGPGTGFSIWGDSNSGDSNPVVQTGAPDAAGTAGNLAANGVEVYFGADDNLDAGEHDGVDNRPETGTDGTANGPSDGGAIHAFVKPGEVGTSPSASNPVPFAGVSFGSCADGICEDVTTYRHTIYSGSGEGERDAANYDGKTWDPYECDGASLDGEQSCAVDGGPQNLNDWRAQEGDVYAEPGAQVYEDPDAQASPIDPLHEILSGAGISEDYPLYPLPGTYAGTCGVILQGQIVSGNPAAAC